MNLTQTLEENQALDLLRSRLRTREEALLQLRLAYFWWIKWGRKSKGKAELDKALEDIFGTPWAGWPAAQP